MKFFLDSTVTLSAKLLELLYMFMGAIALYAGIKTLFEKEHKSRVSTAIFWIALGIVLAFGRWIPSMVNGSIVARMAIPAVLHKVQSGSDISASK